MPLALARASMEGKGIYGVLHHRCHWLLRGHLWRKGHLWALRSYLTGLIDARAAPVAFRTRRAENRQNKHRRTGRARMRSRTFLVGSAVVIAAVATAPRAAFAQTYPTQDVHFVCAFAAGSGADIIVRYFSDKMRPLMGRSIIVENEVGAIGNLATEYVARSKPDGHVIYVTGASGVAANMHIFKNPSVDVGNALQIAATINKATMMLGVRADAPWKTAPELTAAMKLKGDKASYAIANPASKVLGALYKEKAGLQSVEVGYRTGADFLNDLHGGNIDYAIPDNIQAMAQARAGRMRILAVGAATRTQSAPDLPTMTELGYPMD